VGLIFTIINNFRVRVETDSVHTSSIFWSAYARGPPCMIYYCILLGFYISLQDLLGNIDSTRSVLWAQSQQLRANCNLDDLSRIGSALAAEFRRISEALRRGSFRSTSKMVTMGVDIREETKLQHSLANDWEKLVRRICLLPSFGIFLRPLRSSQLRPAASNGRVMLVDMDATSSFSHLTALFIMSLSRLLSCRNHRAYARLSTWATS
jgi:hypothetical protein